MIRASVMAVICAAAQLDAYSPHFGAMSCLRGYQFRCARHPAGFRQDGHGSGLSDFVERLGSRSGTTQRLETTMGAAELMDEAEAARYLKCSKRWLV